MPIFGSIEPQTESSFPFQYIIGRWELKASYLTNNNMRGATMKQYRNIDNQYVSYWKNIEIKFCGIFLS